MGESIPVRAESTKRGTSSISNDVITVNPNPKFRVGFLSHTHVFQIAREGGEEGLESPGSFIYNYKDLPPHFYWGSVDKAGRGC